MSRAIGAFVMGYGILAVFLNGIVFVGSFLNHPDVSGWRAWMADVSMLVFFITLPIGCLALLVGGVMLLLSINRLGRMIAVGGLIANWIASVALLIAIVMVYGMVYVPAALVFSLPAAVMVVPGRALYKRLML